MKIETTTQRNIAQITSHWLAILSLAVAVPSASATLITYDGLDYTSGDNLHGSSGGSGWGTNWDNQSGLSSNITVSSPGLSYGSLVVGGNAVTTNSFDSTGRRLDVSFTGAWDGAGFVSDPFVDQQIDQGNVWGSFLARRNAATATWDGGPQFSLHRNNISWFTDTASSALQITWNATSNVWVASSGASSTNLTGSGLGDTVLFVFKLELSLTPGANNIYVWMDPTGLGGADLLTSTADASFTGLDTADARFKAFRAYGGGSATNATTFDEVRFGTTFASVTPIPEPSTYVLLGLGLGTLWWLRRRKVA
ncbi:MAG: hypothetical protein OHK005_17630 [Candidatus Methylacidiphilales bacterium]